MKLKIIPILLGIVALGLDTPDISDNFFQRLMDDSIILHQEGLERKPKDKKNFVTTFLKENGPIDAYEEKFTIDVNSSLVYEIGQIRTQLGVFPVMFLKRTDQNSKIEFLVIYKRSEAEDARTQLDESRDQWVKLCNSHQAGQLVSQLYTSDALYYNRGRLIQGTQAISQEYGYMNHPSYSLALTPKHIVFVTPEIAYEIGRCSGSYPLPYMLLWGKQQNDQWKILMDSNF